MNGIEDGRGVLYPARLPTFHRVPAPEDLRELIRWFWIPQWRLAPGRSSRQRLLPFPASNLVVEADGISLAGPTTGASHRDLRGQGWAVGALLRPAGLASLHPAPHTIRDAAMPFVAPELLRPVRAAMEGAGEDEERRSRAVEAYGAWIAERCSPPDPGGRIANELEDLIASDAAIVRVEQVADRLGLSVRRAQRIAHRYIGLPPLTVIRRYRLQGAAQRLREDPEATIAQLAAELGYADHAHLSTDFRAVLGVTPSAYRGESG